ncbi:DegT/DnrJ/EryC1/StrS aminotransferase family protein [Nitrosopumilus sp.]|jgi:dTDP-4-amino-4,6-dideoxygalactose transaminase|nr:DegT/DnrJ/EryC1/StrS aminotransferase family protein [Nitrosopumilus sp.]
MDRIPVFSPSIDNDTKEHLDNALDVGWLGMGASTKEFEDRISEFLKLKNRFVVTTNTGTSALHIALRAANVGPGDEVITPSFNYVADHQAIKMTGADVVMCDIEEDNLGMDCEKAEKLITNKTKAIVPLHFAGIPCNQKKIYKMAKKYNLRVIEDAMHAFGTTIDGKKIGSYGDITCFSFDPVKIITSIDGGCVVVNTKKESQILQKLRLLGVDKDTTERYKNKRSWDYDVVSEGYRYHLTNIMASIGISQIKKIKTFISNRQKICQEYNQAFKKIKQIKIPQSDFTNVSPFIYSLRILNGQRDDLIKHLDTLGIDVGIHFIPVHKHKYFSNSKFGNMDITDKVVKEALTLPLHSNMKNTDIQRVVKGITSFFKN